jgi:DNA/RNA-binding domain of Phe-tRNA-synthetase-like protein
MLLTISTDAHPLLEIGAFVTRFATALARTETPPNIAALTDPNAGAPLTGSDQIRSEVRQLLRSAGFKPAGRSKPASEYVTAAAIEGRFPRINAAVDACNVVSLHSGLPISLVDVDRITGTHVRIGVAPSSTTYVFNPSGQVIDASHLVCAFDADGPTGTPVKDAQRTKTHDDTRTTLSIVWGTSALPGRTDATTLWYCELVATIAGATIEDVTRR